MRLLEASRPGGDWQDMQGRSSLGVGRPALQCQRFPRLVCIVPWYYGQGSVTS